MRVPFFEDVQKAINFLRRRRQSYVQVFLGGPAGEDVLADLAKFCRANDTCFDPDPRVHAALEGRREVWLRIQQHLNLNAEDLFDLYNGGPLKQRDDENV
jgi:hypothetical protein